MWCRTVFSRENWPTQVYYSSMQRWLSHSKNSHTSWNSIPQPLMLHHWKLDMIAIHTNDIQISEYIIKVHGIIETMALPTVLNAYQWNQDHQSLVETDSIHCWWIKACILYYRGIEEGVKFQTISDSANKILFKFAKHLSALPKNASTSIN